MKASEVLEAVLEQLPRRWVGNATSNRGLEPSDTGCIVQLVNWETDKRLKTRTGWELDRSTSVEKLIRNVLNKEAQAEHKCCGSITCFNDTQADLESMTLVVKRALVELQDAGL